MCELLQQVLHYDYQTYSHNFLQVLLVPWFFYPCHLSNHLYQTDQHQLGQQHTQDLSQIILLGLSSSFIAL